jgi:A/G-specific adenine glycosylase
MLQQTRVDTVIPYYERFLARFPDVNALAAADEESVLREWSGLGYYARARNLRRAAQIVSEQHAGELPSDPDALGALPGVGRYTVGALQSIAFDREAPIVDGNIKRVFARWFAEPELSVDANWALASELVRGSHPADFNQALMELGALVCTPRSPSCSECPVVSDCQAAASEDPEAYPRAIKKKKPVEISATSGVLSRGAAQPELLMLRRPSKGLLGGLWELPSCPGGDTAGLLKHLDENLGLNATLQRPLGTIRHIFTHRALTLDVVELRLDAEAGSGSLRKSESGDARWVGLAELEELPLSTLRKKVLRLVSSARPQSPERPEKPGGKR